MKLCGNSLHTRSHDIFFLKLQRPITRFEKIVKRFQRDLAKRNQQMYPMKACMQCVLTLLEAIFRKKRLQRPGTQLEKVILRFQRDLERRSADVP